MKKKDLQSKKFFQAAKIEFFKIHTDFQQIKGILSLVC